MSGPYMQLNPKKGSFWERFAGRHDVVFVSHQDDANTCIGKIEKVGRAYRWSLYGKSVKAGTTLTKEPEVTATEKCGKITNAVFCLRQLYNVRSATSNNT